MPGFSELLVILLIILLIFGGSKIPQIARSMGSGIREFKKATSSDAAKKDDKNPSK